MYIRIRCTLNITTEAYNSIFTIAFVCIDSNQKESIDKGLMFHLFG